MIKLYKKVDGKKVEVNNLSEINKPYLISLDEEDKLLNTSIIGKENNTKIDIIGIDYFDDKNKTKAEELVDEIILPFISDGKSNELNFITTGKYAISYLVVESALKSRLEKMNFSNEQINNIISKLSYVSLLSNVDTSELKSSSIVFTDVNNEDTKTVFNDEYKEFLNNSNTDKIAENYGSANSIIYIFKGTGKSELEDYVKEPGFKMVISYLLEKSAKQEDKNYEDILEVLRNTPTEDLIKYSFSYPKQKSDIDIAVEAANDIVKLYKDEENKRKKIEKQMDRLIACVKEYSSDITYNQILMASGILGFEDPTFLNEESDKVVRSNYEKVKKN